MSTKKRTSIETVDRGVISSHRDDVATEEPLEIRLRAQEQTRTLAITMRTPGSDFELTAGFLYSEGVIDSRSQIGSIIYCNESEVLAEERFNIVTAHLAAGHLPELRGLERNFFVSSSCGVCGKATLDALSLRGCSAIGDGPVVTSEVVYSLPERLREGQGVFGDTGGLHAAGLFTTDGELLVVREDVGRHNALDKVIGWGLLNDELPFSNRVIMVSGRSSFEIMQKSLVAGAPIVCAVSAPSSLAVDVATRFGMTLVGFLRGERFNVYANPQRIRSAS